MRLERKPGRVYQQAFSKAFFSAQAINPQGERPRLLGEHGQDIPGTLRRPVPRVNVSREGIAFWRISPGLVFLNNFYLCGSGSPA